MVYPMVCVCVTRCIVVNAETDPASYSPLSAREVRNIAAVSVSVCLFVVCPLAYVHHYNGAVRSAGTSDILPLPSSRHHLSYDDCLDDEGKLSELYCALLCTAVVHSNTHTLKAKFHYAILSQTGPKLVADLQRAGIWPII